MAEINNIEDIKDNFEKITNLLIIRKKKNSKIGTKSTPRRQKVPKNAILKSLIFSKLQRKSTKNCFFCVLFFAASTKSGNFAP